MWGTFQRDFMTIPSRAGAMLAQRGIREIRYTNFGETGYVFTQEVIELLLQLRDGLRPSVVVFYDGLNDVIATVQSGVAGISQNEGNREQEFQLGRAVFSWRNDLITDLRVAGRLGLVASQRLQLLGSLRSGVGVGARSRLPADSLARSLASSYEGTVAVVEALGQRYGFRALYVWQPSLQATRKSPSTFERTLLAEIERDAFQRKLRDLHVRVPRVLDSSLTRVVGDRFIDLSGLFAGDSTTVFLDVIGHTTEEASDAIARRIAPALETLLAAQPRTGKSCD
jgi:hypothetical protein